MSEVELGTKNSTNLIEFTGLFVRLLIKEAMTDGIQISDAVKIVTSSEFRDKLAIAVSGISQVPRELADLSTFDALDIARALLDTTTSIMKSIDERRAA